MPTIFWKNILKCLPTITPSSHPLPSDQLQEYRDPLSSSTTLISPTTSIIIKNFNSPYDLSSAPTSKSPSTPSTNSFSSSYSDSDAESNLDFATILASQRLFFSSPGRSNSIIESLPEPQTVPVSGGVAIKKYSPDPYTDFKHSMQEMIEARELRDFAYCLRPRRNPTHTGNLTAFVGDIRVLDTLDGCLIGWEIRLISNGRCMAAGRVRLFALVFAVVLRVLNQHQHQQQGAD
ncbi:hypothetical protein POTOM_030185 [Populus tomentosa]|uniref:Transcription repressor n=1 Tax=Populus tomentosa TaxID=118781 RepID=A0A8X8CTL1_POPTO|nr:hypothetical protein POTOM_030185 [Populus tomentosa]